MLLQNASCFHLTAYNYMSEDIFGMCLCVYIRMLFIFLNNWPNLELVFTPVQIYHAVIFPILCFHRG